MSTIGGPLVNCNWGKIVILFMNDPLVVCSNCNDPGEKHFSFYVGRQRLQAVYAVQFFFPTYISFVVEVSVANLNYIIVVGNSN